MKRKPPHRFSIEIGAAFTDVTKYSIEYGVLQCVPRAHPTRRVTPTLTEWTGFWRFCDFLEIWEWKTEYSPADSGLAYRGGTSWVLDIAFSKSKRIQSAGHNVYPSFEDPGKSAVTMDRFGVLLNFVDRMLFSADDWVPTPYADDSSS